MKNSFTFFLLAMCLLLSSCNQSTLTQAPIQPSETPFVTPISYPDMPTSTSIVIPTATSTTHPTLIPTNSPQPIQAPYLTPTNSPLSENGPWLVYSVPGVDVVAVNADGTGRKVLIGGLPGGARIAGSTRNQLAIMTLWPELGESVLQNLAIGIMNLPSGEVVNVIPILSNPNFGTIYQDAPPTLDMAWSPDGNILAFTGAIHGPSTDLYLYNTLLDKLTRLTTGNNRSASPIWSPDGQWIIYIEAENEEGMCGAIVVWDVKADGSETKLLPLKGCWPTVLDWFNPNQFLSIDEQNVAARSLLFVDIEKAEFTRIMPKNWGIGYFDALAWDKQTGQIAFSSMPGNDIGYEELVAIAGDWEASFVVNISNPNPQIVPGEKFETIYWLPMLNSFIGSPGLNCGTVLFSIDHEATCWNSENATSVANISPDGEWAILKTGNEIRFLDGHLPIDESPVVTIGSIPDDFYWTPDGKGVFFQLDRTFYFYDLHSGQLNPIESAIVWSTWVGQ